MVKGTLKGIFSGRRAMPAVGALAVIFAAFLWGLDGVVLTPRLHDLDVAVAVFLLHAVAFAFMMPLMLYEAKELKKIKGWAWLSFFWVALFGGAIGTMAMVKALFFVNFIPLSIPILLQKLQPVFAIILAYIFLKERPKKAFYPFAVLALIGSYLVTFGLKAPVLSSGNKVFVAAVLGLVAAFSWGSSTVFGRKVVGVVNFRVATYVRYGLTTLIMLLLLLSLGKMPLLGAVTGMHWIVLLIISFTTGGTAIAIYYYGLRNITASRATIYELMMPVTVVVLDYIINKNVLSIWQYIGAIILIGSIVLISMTNRSA